MIHDYILSWIVSTKRAFPHFPPRRFAPEIPTTPTSWDPRRSSSSLSSDDATIRGLTKTVSPDDKHTGHAGVGTGRQILDTVGYLMFIRNEREWFSCKYIILTYQFTSNYWEWQESLVGQGIGRRGYCTMAFMGTKGIKWPSSSSKSCFALGFACS